MSQFLFYAGLGVMLLAMVGLLISGLLRKSSGLPEGEIVYNDVDGRGGELLVSERYRLSGKPDYLVEGERGALIPVEIKSGAAPPGGQPYRSHRFQLAVYFLLIEDVLGTEAPHGLIRYRDRTLRVPNSAALRAELLAVVGDMRKALRAATADRTHTQPRRCSRCSMAGACDQKLA